MGLNKFTGLQIFGITAAVLVLFAGLICMILYFTCVIGNYCSKPADNSSGPIDNSSGPINNSSGPIDNSSGPIPAFTPVDNDSFITDDTLQLIGGDGVKQFYTTGTGGSRELDGSVKGGEDGLTSKSDLNNYLLTYPAGHETYSIKNNSWKNFVESNSNKINLPSGDLSSKILLIQGKDSSYFIDDDCDLRGIVVRQGARLFINDKPLRLRIGFMLIESGGLFQAGSRYSDNHRFKSALNIILTHPKNGYQDNMNVASQYSYSIYSPGVKRTDGALGATTYTGTQDAFMNSFGTKVIAVGFNGNYQLAGFIGTSPQPYEGTWNAFDSSNNEHIGKNELLTYFKVGDSDAVKANVETQYSVSWCRLKEGKYDSGSSVINIDDRDGKYLHWKSGDKIVITCSTSSFSDLTKRNMVPLWMDCDDPASASANAEANEKFFAALSIENTGVEVATIDKIDGNKITLKNPLKFDHNCFREQITNDNGKTITIDTNLHVALLTRNILITSEFTEGGSGCNGKNMPNGSSIVCNYDNTCQGSGLEVYGCCYENRTSEDFCGSEKVSDQEAKGHWMFNNSGLTGCNAIYGGHQMFRYGSSVHLDGVEMRYMGCPSNFGHVGRYPVHFHLSGYAKSWKGYIPNGDNVEITDNVYTRESAISNCSIWASLNRWVTTHGAHEVDIKNNVGFVSYGSGYFVEDGTEIDNTFEHNTAIACLTASYHAYWNPTPLFPSVSSDLSPASAFWFKNNQNRCFRNLSCCCAQPIIAIWLVPQAIAYLRGPSTVCVGDPDLELPALASTFNVWGEPSNVCYMNQNKQTAADLGLGDNGNCWVPESFYKQRPIAESVSHCPVFSNVNCENPINLIAENIVYCMLGGISEFPEALGESIGNYTGKGPFGTTNGWNVGVCEAIDPKNTVPQWMSFDSNNSCTDSNTQCTYFGTKWGGTTIGTNGNDYPFQPLSETELAAYNNGDQKFVGIAKNPQADVLPKIYSNFLMWNLGPNANSLWGGAGWSKNAPAWLINCCLLQTGGGTTVVNPGGLSSGEDCSDSLNPTIAVYNKNTSSVWANTTGDAINVYTNAYYVMHNLISNGGVGIPANPTIMSGDKTFFGTSNDDEASAIEIEYSNMAVSDNKIYCTFDPSAVFPSTFFDSFENYPPKLYSPSDNWQSGTSTEKMPYLCQNDKLWRLSDLSNNIFTDKYNPEWMGIVANSQIGHFLNTYAKDLGDEMCLNLSKIPGCAKPTNPQRNDATLYC